MTARLSLSPGGGTGFIGTALTRLLRSRGHQVTHVSRREGEDRISWVRAESGHRRGNVSGLRNQPGALAFHGMEGACQGRSGSCGCSFGLLDGSQSLEWELLWLQGAKLLHLCL